VEQGKKSGGCIEEVQLRPRYRKERFVMAKVERGEDWLEIEGVKKCLSSLRRRVLKTEKRTY